MNINATLFAQAIVFAILIWFTMKFIWPPIAKALDERALKISEGLAASEKAKTELLDRFDRSFGRELTELFLSGAADWHERHPPDISQSWDKSDPNGVNAPATYNAYTNEMLRTTADNGDVLAAALYGARLAAEYLRGDGSSDEATMR